MGTVFAALGAFVVRHRNRVGDCQALFLASS